MRNRNVGISEKILLCLCVLCSTWNKGVFLVAKVLNVPRGTLGGFDYLRHF